MVSAELRRITVAKDAWPTVTSSSTAMQTILAKSDVGMLPSDFYLLDEDIT